MVDISTKLGLISFICGGVALLVALVHFYAGPFAPEPTIAEKAVEIRDATVAAFRGEELEKKTETTHIDIDRIIGITAFALGYLAIMLGVTGWVFEKGKRFAIGGAFLGGWRYRCISVLRHSAWCNCACRHPGWCSFGVRYWVTNINRSSSFRQQAGSTGRLTAPLN